MKKLSTKQTILPLLLILSIGNLFFRFYQVKALNPIVTGSNFNLYFTSGNSLQFQHLKTEWGAVAFIAKVTVNSGTLNGTNGNIEMYPTEGKLSFTSQNTATLTPSDNLVIIVNGEQFQETTTIKTGDSVIFRWSGPAFEPSLPVLFIFGMVGLFSMFLGPIYTVHKIKQKEYREAAITGFLVTLIGLVLFISWLSA